MPSVTSNGNNDKVTFADDYSTFTAVSLMKSKDEVVRVDSVKYYLAGRK